MTGKTRIENSMYRQPVYRNRQLVSFSLAMLRYSLGLRHSNMGGEADLFSLLTCISNVIVRCVHIAHHGIMV